MRILSSLLIIALLVLSGCSETNKRKVFNQPTKVYSVENGKAKITIVNGEETTNALGMSLSFNYTNPKSEYYYLTIYRNACDGNKIADEYIDSTNDNDKKPEKCVDKRTIIRNRIMSEILSLVDKDYGIFEKQVRSDKAYKNIFADIVSLALTGSASVSPAGAARTLAAIDTGFKGANASIDANAFENKSSEVLINEMRYLRKTQLNIILKNMKTSDQDYTLEEGIRDITVYYNAGNITSALAELSNSVSSNLKDATTALNKTQTPP